MKFYRIAGLKRLAGPAFEIKAQAQVLWLSWVSLQLIYDLVGSTALRSRPDPEDLREVIGVCFILRRRGGRGFDGFIAK